MGRLRNDIHHTDERNHEEDSKVPSIFAVLLLYILLLDISIMKFTTNPYECIYL
jgi:hypothetical protein